MTDQRTSSRENLSRPSTKTSKRSGISDAVVQLTVKALREYRMSDENEQSETPAPRYSRTAAGIAEGKEREVKKSGKKVPLNYMKQWSGNDISLVLFVTRRVIYPLYTVLEADRIACQGNTV